MEKQTMTIDGVQYEVEQFSQAVQQAVGIYNTFQADLQKQQLEVLKVQSALQSIGAQIIEAVKKELEEKKKASSEEASPV
jgi:hypothetical protein